MEKVELEILGISYSQSQSGAYALILGEIHGNRRLPIIIGGFEAQAIAIELEKMKPSRPLTHDLLKNLATTFSIIVSEVIIYKFLEGIFYAKLICSNGIEDNEIDARTSDAVALAVRFKCPIYTSEDILATAGIILADDNKDDDESTETESTYISEERIKQGYEFTPYSAEELEDLLTKAIEDENYERASLIRDEINKRKNI